MRNSELSLRGWLRILLASLFAVFVLTVPSAFSAETPTEVPTSLVAPWEPTARPRWSPTRTF